jgi:predicted secreted Zn-dependent protease
VRALLLCLVAVTGCRTTQPRPRAPITLPATLWPKDTQIHWYDIEGDTEAELREQLDARGPEIDGSRHDAYTSWYVTWRYPDSHSEAGCSTGPVTADVKVVVTLPRWKGFTDENDPLVRRWRRYLEALKTHESGHRETGFRAALPPQATCELASQVADETARKILDEYRARDVEYDAETNHGITQGAVFP